LRAGRRHILHLARALAATALLAGCDPARLVQDDRPPPRPAPPRPAPPPARSAESEALARYYARVQDSFLAQGLLRTDGGGPDVPFDARDLVENFIRIALFEEYATVDGRIIARQTPSRLHKWVAPVRMQVIFGRTVPRDQQRRDRDSIAAYVARLSRITGLPMRLVPENANFHVFIVNEEERRALGDRIRRLLPGIDEATVKAVTDMPRSTFCLVFALNSEETGTYSRALAVIRGEHPDLMRLSCIHEEIAQGLGLSNDSPKARPSIFNDDEEFALLTSHDEMLLRILYDPRTIPGMTAREARPIVETIAAELLGGSS